MKKAFHKVKALTITELMIVMILTGISISIVTMSYFKFTAYNSRLGKDFDQINNVLNFYDMFRCDLEDAELILFKDPNLLLKNKDDYTNYEFKPNYLLRITQKRDTFYIKTKDLLYNYVNVDKQIIDRIEMKVIIDNSTIIPVKWYKRYPEGILFQYSK